MKKPYSKHSRRVVNQPQTAPLFGRSRGAYEREDNADASSLSYGGRLVRATHEPRDFAPPARSRLAEARAFLSRV